MSTVKSCAFNTAFKWHCWCFSTLGVVKGCELVSSTLDYASSLMWLDLHSLELPLVRILIWNSEGMHDTPFTPVCPDASFGTRQLISHISCVWLPCASLVLGFLPSCLYAGDNFWLFSVFHATGSVSSSSSASQMASGISLVSFNTRPDGMHQRSYSVSSADQWSEATVIANSGISTGMTALEPCKDPYGQRGPPMCLPLKAVVAVKLNSQGNGCIPLLSSTSTLLLSLSSGLASLFSLVSPHPFLLWFSPPYPSLYLLLIELSGANATLTVYQCNGFESPPVRTPCSVYTQGRTLINGCLS